MVNFERQGLDTTLLTDELIIDIFKKLEVGAVGKESVPLIFEKIMKKEAATVEQAIEILGIAVLTTRELEEIISKILVENMNTIKQKQMDSLGLLMGRSMAILRGKADGQKINEILKKRLQELLKLNPPTSTEPRKT
jgi:glutamyl-tRNA(Gln) amidotransferase subunit E